MATEEEYKAALRLAADLGAELARLRQETIRQEACNADLLLTLNVLSKKYDALAAENRVIRDAFKNAVTYLDVEPGWTVPPWIEDRLRAVLKQPHTAREVKRVNVLERVAQRFASLNAEYHRFENGQSIPPEPWVEMEWTLGAKALAALDKLKWGE